MPGTPFSSSLLLRMVPKDGMTMEYLDSLLWLSGLILLFSPSHVLSFWYCLLESFHMPSFVEPPRALSLLRLSLCRVFIWLASRLLPPLLAPPRPRPLLQVSVRQEHLQSHLFLKMMLAHHKFGHPELTF